MIKEKLLPKELLKKFSTFEELDKQTERGETDYMILAKYFYPDFSWTWYAIAYDKEAEIFFGLVDGDFVELGDFALSELMENKGKFGCEIERDFGWQPKKVSEVRKICIGQQ